MKKILIAIIAMAVCTSANAQSIHEQGSTLKSSIDTGITNKNATNKVRATTEGGLIKKVADYTTNAYDSAQAHVDSASYKMRQLLTSTFATQTAVAAKADQATTITVNGVTQTLAASRTFNTGTVTSVIGGRGITGGTVTSSGTLALDTVIAATNYQLKKKIDSLSALINSVDNQNLILTPPYQQIPRILITKRVTAVRISNYLSNSIAVVASVGNNVGDLLYLIFDGTAAPYDVGITYGSFIAPYNATFMYTTNFNQPLTQGFIATSSWIWTGTAWNLLSHSENTEANQ